MKTRVQYQVFPTYEAAIAAGWDGAEMGTWQPSPRSPVTVWGWIALSDADQMEPLKEGEVQEFLREFTELSLKYRLGVAGPFDLFVMEDDDRHIKL